MPRRSKLLVSLALLALSSASAISAGQTVPATFKTEAEPSSQTVTFVDASGKLIAVVDEQGVVRVVPGELLSHATRMLFTLTMGTATANYSVPYPVPTTSTKTF
ncbi:hypothetical protein MF271_19845 (plasmid) [Deinococcus sp. KNUC1210]|uniref:hypothetical protein n=1 Tax=Deinococcus sp. KNUC1210 TaxID=2917691 RepID=UPI001EF0BBA0|nr:hypothetical protein [Deinococcus sp. KNUC1210]ULH17668.1 hypothetical protein MF271_19845 [Deinococcus sp. KNUC1210]